jgi:hypothetical protein
MLGSNDDLYGSEVKILRHGCGDAAVPIRYNGSNHVVQVGLCRAYILVHRNQCTGTVSDVARLSVTEAVPQQALNSTLQPYGYMGIYLEAQ